MAASLINVSESHSHREAALQLTAELGSPFLFPALFLSLSKQNLVSYQLEWAGHVDPMLEAHRGCPTPIGTTNLWVECYTHYTDEQIESQKDLLQVF